LSAQRPELSGKQLEILKEIMPKLARVAVFGNNQEPGNRQNLKEVELAAKALGIKVHYLSVASPKDIEIAFRAATEDFVVNLKTAKALSLTIPQSVLYRADKVIK
jgi:putative ABC transport system substrate-binding protein